MSVTKREIELSDGSYEMIEHRSSPVSVIMAFGAASAMMLTALAYGGVINGSGKPAIIDDVGNEIEMVGNLSPTLDWFCDWENSPLGDSTAAILCDGKFDQLQTSHLDSILTVQDTTPGVGWPGFAHTLQVYYPDTGSGLLMMALDRWNAQVGDYIFWRYYYYAGADAIGIQIAGHFFHLGSNFDGENDYITFVTQQDGNTFQSSDSLFDGLAITSGVQDGGVTGTGRGIGNFALEQSPHQLRAFNLYRMEGFAHRIHTDSVHLNIRIYDEVGDSLYVSGEDFICPPAQNCTAGDTLGEFNFFYNSANYNGWRDLEFGNNGPPEAQSSGGRIELGGLAIRVSTNSNDWIGPYPVNGVEN